MAKAKSSRRSSRSSSIKVGVDKDSSVEVRQIENGFIVRESGSSGKGRNQKYYSKEFFSPNNPLKIASGGAPSGNGGMKFGGKRG